MFIYLGTLSFFQAFFLPGIAVAKASNKKLNLASVFLYCVPLSLILNYAVIFFLTSIGLYYSTSIWTLCAIELFFIWYFRSPKPGSKELHRVDLNKVTNLDFLGFAFFITTFFYYLTRWIKSFGSILNHWDAVSSWNRWGLDWYANQLPKNTGEYPQLVPILYSIGYKFIHSTEVTFFAKSTVVSIPLFASLAVFSVGLKYRSLRLFCTLASGLYLIVLNSYAYPLTGIADAPVASIVFIGIGFALLQMVPVKMNTKHFYFGAAIIGLACLTKQAGLPFILFYPLLVLTTQAVTSPKKPYLISFAISSIIAGSWYIYKEIQFFYHTDGSWIGGVLAASNGTISQKLIRCLSTLGEIICNSKHHLLIRGAAITGVVIVFISGMTRSRLFMMIAIIALVQFLIWATANSYDTRNFAYAAGPISLVLASGLEKIANLLPIIWLNKLNRNPKVFNFFQSIQFSAKYFLTTVLLVLAFAQYKISDASLIQRQTEQAYDIENGPVNRAVVTYFRANGLKAKIGTHYGILQFVPEVGRFNFNFYCNSYVTPMEEWPAEIGYILVAKFCGNDSKQAMAKLVEQKKATQLWELDGYTFYELFR